MKNAIFKNTSYLLSAQVITKAVSFFYTIFLARSLGVDNFGLYTVALSYFSLLSAFSDFGISRFLIREIARESNKSSLIFNILVLRTSVTLVLFILFALGLTLFDHSMDRVTITIIATAAILPQSIALTIDAIFIALQKINISAIGLLFLSLFTAVTGTFLVYQGFGDIGAAIGLILGEIMYAVILGIMLLRQKIPILSTFDRKLVKEIVIGSLPYGLLGILGLLYFKIDTILLSYMKGSYDTGIYAAGYRFLEAIIVIPTAVSAAMFPVLAKLHDTDLDHVKRIYYKSLNIMFLLSIPILLGYMFILPIIVKMLLPQYVESIFAIQVLALTIPLMFMHNSNVTVLLSTDKLLKPVIYLSFGTLAFNLILNILLIPKFGYMAAALVTVLSEALSFLVFYFLIKYKLFK